MCVRTTGASVGSNPATFRPTVCDEPLAADSRRGFDLLCVGYLTPAGSRRRALGRIEEPPTLE
ncbi:hypothetical protein HLY00_3206 [Mycolicibacterium hippocampi]|uniref:Uncharacterized protein n=1 Tax=Mycolicibacterium hippocampi TaxID=659824 RepID=A0A850PUY1_9MYCO|nr:hypothetical protein [Mycolicibacterium hippocampi]